MDNRSHSVSKPASTTSIASTSTTVSTDDICCYYRPQRLEENQNSSRDSSVVLTHVYHSTDFQEDHCHYNTTVSAVSSSSAISTVSTQRGTPLSERTSASSSTERVPSTQRGTPVSERTSASSSTERVPVDGNERGFEYYNKESIRAKQHLELLQEEYKKLQHHCNNVESKLSLISTSDKIIENNFIARLYKTVTSLHGSDLFSDLRIELKEKAVLVHKLVLHCRSSQWGVPSLATVSSLDWTNINSKVADTIIKWVYTDQVDFPHSDEFTLDLMNHANTFHLFDLVHRCENILIGAVNIKNCVKYYTVADSIGAETLKNHSSELISTYWDKFTREDFAHMAAPLLYHMFKAKTEYPLHSAVRLLREDVVFLYLVEFSHELSTKLNRVDNRGDLPLGLALETRQVDLAETFLQKGADPDSRDDEGWTLLQKAIHKGDYLAAKFLLEHKASMTLVNPNGDSVLHMIASSNEHGDSREEFDDPMVDIAKILLDRGLDPNIRNKDGLTALHFAVVTKYEQLFALLLSQKTIDLNVRSAEGHTPLWFALSLTPGINLYSCNTFAVQLIENGAIPNPIYPHNGDSLLHMLIAEGLKEASCFLCRKINNIDHVNMQGESALHVACRQDLVEVVVELLECGANPNIQTVDDSLIIPGEPSRVYRLTPIHVAIAAGNTNSVKAIIDHKITAEDTNDAVLPNFNIRDARGNTPLSLALLTGMKSIVPDLVKAGADVNMRNEEGLTLLHQAIIKKDALTAEYLINNGASIDAKTMADETPLQLAITHQLPKVVDVLCNNGIDMSIKDGSNNCPLWAALESLQEDIASILVRHGVDTDCWSEGPDGCMQTLLHRAIDERRDKIANFLIENGCDLNSPRQAGPGGRGGEEAHDGQTPLHLCCQWGLESVVQTLVDHDANVNIKDAEGKTPLHVAIQNQHPLIINLLLYHPNLNLSLPDNSGLTPFATALVYRNNKAAQAIRDRYPTAAEQFDGKGRNFLHTAIQKNDVESVLFLLSIEVDVNSRVRDTNQSTPLHLAAQIGNELLVRNLLLASARPNDRDGHKRTPLHIAAESGEESVISALLQNGADYDAVDSEGDNALHVAVREGHLAAIRTLLTESRLNAEAVNLKGRNPLHTLARYARDNAASICELFFECMPTYPLNKPDLEGNTALILAYTKGNGNLCRVLVRAGACVGHMNKDGVTIFNYQVASNSKTLLKSLLDSLSKEPPWVEGDICLECGTKFGLTMRKHHCRHCGRLLCSKCSHSEVPILKFNLNKPVRVCDVCFEVLHVGVS